MERWISSMAPVLSGQLGGLEGFGHSVLTTIIGQRSLAEI